MKDEKILNEEILSTEELENVSGGGSRQMEGDNEFMKRMTGAYYFGHSPEMRSKAVEKGWAKFGIRVDTHIGELLYNLRSFNYYIGDKEISRQDAFRHAMKQSGWSQTDIDNFDWDGVKGAW